MNENERIVYEFLRKIERTLAAFERLEAENAKLRELLHEALLFGSEQSYGKERFELKQQARELGIEV